MYIENGNSYGTKANSPMAMNSFTKKVANFGKLIFGLCYSGEDRL